VRSAGFSHFITNIQYATRYLGLLLERSARRQRAADQAVFKYGEGAVTAGNAAMRQAEVLDGTFAAVEAAADCGQLVALTKPKRNNN
jgi:hypothetical protein